MGINLQHINDSPLVIDLLSSLGRMLPLRVGHSLADLVAGQIAGHRDSHMIRAVRANQWVVRGETSEKGVLDQAVRETLHNSARSIFDLYHYIQNEPATRQLITMDHTIQQLVKRQEFEPRGLVIAGLHLGNFDLILQWLCWRGLRPMVLTIPDPQGGRRTEYERRKKAGMNLVPASVSAIRQALRHLQQGGVVMTGIDRPIPDPKAWPRFFGRPAALPMHHVFLAARAQVPVMVMVTIKQADGTNHVMTSEPIEMNPHPDREVEALQNAEKVLSVAAGFIRQTPQQWSISLPVWPETLDLVP
jgi:lauroyl/myristoyl acyltransferase